MAKKDMRVIVASDSAVGLIDRGADVDVELKNLSFEDKGIKASLINEFSGKITPDETSVVLEGAAARATLTRKEKISLDEDNAGFAAVIDSIETRSKLAGIVTVGVALDLPVQSMSEALKVLKAAGIQASLRRSYSVDAAALRDAPDSDEVRALKAVTITETTYAVKYSRK